MLVLWQRGVSLTGMLERSDLDVAAARLVARDADSFPAVDSQGPPSSHTAHVWVSLAVLIYACVCMLMCICACMRVCMYVCVCGNATALWRFGGAG
jgi:hypothetical protein